MSLSPASWRALQQDLLLLLQSTNNINTNIQDLSHNIRRSQSQPLRQTDISNSLRFVDLNPNQVLSWRSILDIVTRVIRECSGVSCLEVDRASVLVADEYCCLSLAAVEV